MRETWWIAAGAEDLLQSRGLDSVAAGMAVAAEGARLSSDRQSAAVRLDGDPPLLLKWRRPLPRRRWKTCGRPSRERNEAGAMLLAASLGIEAPVPLAVAERRRGLLLEGALYVRPFLTDTTPANGALVGTGADEFALALAGHLARWHETGFRHGDCYPKNVLVAEAGRRALPIGAPRATVAPRGRGRADRGLLRDLAQWAVGTGAIFGCERAFAFLDAYRAARREAPPADLRHRIQPFYARILAKKARRVATRPQREPHGAPLPVPLPPEARRPPRTVRDLDSWHPRPSGDGNPGL